MALKGQTSIELASITGLFILAVTAALVGIYPGWDAANRVGAAEATMRDIKNTVENVYSSGPGRRETITVRIPAGVERTEVSNGRLDMVLGLPEGDTDVLEVTAAPVRGRIPSVDGVHRLVIEHTFTGYVILGSSLSAEPQFVELRMSPDNSTSFQVNVTNAGDSDIPDVRAGANGSWESWFSINETGFSLIRGQTKTVLVRVDAPDAAPGAYPNLLAFEAGDQYADSRVVVLLEGSVCGDGIREGAEMCDSTRPFPDRESDDCKNPSAPPGGVSCNISSHSFKSFRPGDCLSSCVCSFPDAVPDECGSGCDDSDDPLGYCRSCNHCFDRVENCGESEVDSGGDCQVWEGQFCGNSSECPGVTQPWGLCDSFGSACRDLGCCSCGGNPYDPQPTFNGSSDMSRASCRGKATECAAPSGCSGGTYGMECRAIGDCEVDRDMSVWDFEPNASVCAGTACRSEENACFDATYPCHGRRTSYVCDGGGSCQPSISDDWSVCEDNPACPAPSVIILQKMDDNEASDYVDAPACRKGGVGVYYTYPNQQCTEGNFAHWTYTSMYINEPGAYAPYQNGTLQMYGKAWHVSNSFYHDVCGWNPGGCRRSYLRIGTDGNNYLEYDAPVWAANWQQRSVDLRYPKSRVGAVDWNRIGYLQFNYVVGRECQPTDTGCESCIMYIDYVTLRKT